MKAKLLKKLRKKIRVHVFTGRDNKQKGNLCVNDPDNNMYWFHTDRGRVERKRREIILEFMDNHYRKVKYKPLKETWEK